MSTPKLIFGLLDTSRAVADPFVSSRLRELTIAWSRFKYFGSIIESESIDAILAQALQRNVDYCLVQAHGHILDEVWQPDAGASADALTALERWMEGRDFLVAGQITGGRDGTYGLGRRFLLVNLNRYRTLGSPHFGAACARPQRMALPRAVAAQAGGIERLEPTGKTAVVEPASSGWSFVNASLEVGLPVDQLPAAVTALTIDLGPDLTAGGATPVASLRRILDPGLPDLGPGTDFGGLDERAAGFVRRIRGLSEKLPQGVFSWNLESYADVENPPEHFAPPIQALYTVAAGFKPNRILETHGFDERTRMVVFDYSRPGLAFRRLLHERWDGTDYPDFLRRLFRERAVDDAFYVLWNGASPETVHWPDVEARWQSELAAWGGAEALRRHWRRFRNIRVEYVCCDLLREPGPLLERVRNDPAAVIWWSNAFFSVHSNWFYTAADRSQRYRSFVGALAARAPDLFLYGADSNNISVNFIQAKPYVEWYCREGGDEREPARRHGRQIRF